MANESGTGITSLWKHQPVNNAGIPLDQLQRKAHKFEKRILWRNVREYVASAIVIGSFGYSLWIVPDLVIRTGCALIIVGTLFVAYSLHKRGSARPLPVAMAQQTCIEFQRAELIRQRNLLQSVWTWYLLPFVPGMVVFLFGDYLQTMKQPNAAAHRGLIAVVFCGSAAVCALIFLGVAKLNAWGARKLQREIDSLDAAIDSNGGSGEHL